MDNTQQHLKCLMTVTASDTVEVTGGEGRKERKGMAHEEDDQEDLQQAWDDVSGKELDSRGVKKAMMKELGYVADKGVWINMSREGAKRRGIRVIQTRWIDIDKGDVDNPQLQKPAGRPRVQRGKAVGALRINSTTGGIEGANQRCCHGRGRQPGG